MSNKVNAPIILILPHIGGSGDRCIISNLDYSLLYKHSVGEFLRSPEMLRDISTRELLTVLFTQTYLC